MEGLDSSVHHLGEFGVIRNLDYLNTLLLQQAKNERAMKAIDDFIKEKIADTYIVIDPIFKDCTFDHEEWSSKIRTEE